MEAEEHTRGEKLAVILNACFGVRLPEEGAILNGASHSHRNSVATSLSNITVIYDSDAHLQIKVGKVKSTVVSVAKIMSWAWSRIWRF